jgi:hypothetical protein
MRSRNSEAEEDRGTARLIARARSEVAACAPLIPKSFVDIIVDNEKSLSLLAKYVRKTRRNSGPCTYSGDEE